MRESIRRVGTLTARNFKEIVRDPLSLCFLIGLPLLMEILFYFLFHKMTAQFEMINLAPGIVVFSQAFLVLFTGLLIALGLADVGYGKWARYSGKFQLMNLLLTAGLLLFALAVGY